MHGHELHESVGIFETNMVPGKASEALDEMKVSERKGPSFPANLAGSARRSRTSRLLERRSPCK